MGKAPLTPLEYQSCREVAPRRPAASFPLLLMVFCWLIGAVAVLWLSQWITEGGVRSLSIQQREEPRRAYVRWLPLSVAGLVSLGLVYRWRVRWNGGGDGEEGGRVGPLILMAAGVGAMHGVLVWVWMGLGV